MIRLTRRSALAGALAVPTVAGLAHWRWRNGERAEEVGHLLAEHRLLGIGLRASRSQAAL